MVKKQHIERESGQVKILGEHRVGETIHLGRVTSEFADYLGHGSTFEKCHFVFHRCGPRDLVFGKGQYTSCVFQAKRTVTNRRWCNDQFTACVFLGKYVGCEWGAKLEGELGKVEGCDFSKAQLHLSAFYDCDATTLTFPSWPCFTVLDPVDNSKKWLKLGMPDEFRLTQQVVGKGSARCKATTLHWPTCVKEDKISSVSMEDVKELLATQQYILL